MQGERSQITRVRVTFTVSLSQTVPYFSFVKSAKRIIFEN